MEQNSIARSFRVWCSHVWVAIRKFATFIIERITVEVNYNNDGWNVRFRFNPGLAI